MSHGLLNESSSDECEHVLIPLSLRFVYAVLDRFASKTSERLDRSVGFDLLTSLMLPLPTGRLGLRLRLILGSWVVGKLGLRVRDSTEVRSRSGDPGGVNMLLSSLEQILSIREERRDGEHDEFLREDDSDAMRPNARIALPVF